jgi:adenylate cyclase
MQIVCSFRDKQWTVDSDAKELVIGRPKDGTPLGLDLSSDQTVSRPHARLWTESGGWWVEDLASRNGTFVNGDRIRGKLQLGPGDVLRLGETTVTFPELTSDRTQILDLDALTGGHAGAVEIKQARGAQAPAFTHDAASSESARWLAALYALPLHLGEKTGLETLLEAIVERVVSAIPGATRGALLVKDPSGKLLLKAHMPMGQPAVSLTLAQRAMDTHEAFIWRAGIDPTVSQADLAIHSGMYAPFAWGDQTLGVLCVGNDSPADVFTDASLQFLVAVAHHAAMAVMHRQMHEEMKHNATTLQRLLANFSPKIRTCLLERAGRQRLRLGGEKSEVTILASDIRGFTRMSASMDAGDVVDLLNDYFSLLVEVIFKFDGTIDKFVGDAILAVFGSPEPDPDQCEKAVQAAIAMQAAMREANTRRTAAHQVICEIGIGVHCGEVIHGFVGSQERMEFTVIGDAVNRATRYCDGAPAGTILISPETHERVWKSVLAEAMTIGTKHEGELHAFRVKGSRSSPRPASEGEKYD